MRSPRRLLYKHYRWLMRREGMEGKINLDDYLKERICRDFGTSNIDEAAKLYLQEYVSNLIVYRKENMLQRN